MSTQIKSYVLSIAGFDPSAGAGVMSDVKTFEGNGVYGLGVVSALTWQNDVSFEKVEWLPVHKITEQIDVLLKRFEIKYIKIGLVESMDVLQQLISFLKDNIAYPVIVFDPILKASAGFVFHDAGGDAFKVMMQDVYCITPNIPEAEQLFGTDDLQTKLEDMSETVNVYLKGGHSEESSVMDILYTADHTYAFSNDRLEKGAKHGSGCVLSAALTAQLALGNELPVAAENANAYTYRFLASNDTLLGYHQSFVL
ncbi:MAG: hydroxymethylpyrimidine/phosphomethylpyrimidine kinase [Flavipsychrobacter sp.]|nr:hydroxymethylpyrimidine/phosphomethylpyrimidine kinase [Flavipsychrobacter sp.]